MFLRIAEYTAIAIVLLFVITQLIVPAIKGQQLLPLFRRQWKLEKELAQKVQKREESRLRRTINRVTKVRK